MVFKWHDWHVPKFLERFQAYECLWNTESKSYKDRNQRDNAIRSLKEDLNIHGVTEQDIKLKIKSIRTRYSHELAKIKKSTKSCCSMDEVYVPKLFWFAQADNFLNAVYTARNSSSNIDSENNVESHRENSNSDPNPNEEIKPVNIDFNETLFHGAAVGGYSNNLDQKYNNEDSGSDPLVSEETPPHEIIGGHSTPSTLQASKHRHFKRDKKRLNDMLINRAIKQLKEINDANNKEDEFDLFCRSLAFQLKAMPIQRALLCQEKLQSVMVQERLKSMVVDSPGYAEAMSTSPSTSS